MAVAWPSTVPDKFDKGSYNYEPQSGVITSEMSTGYAKKRRRFTAISKYHSGSIILKTSEKEDFETWFYSTAGFGTEDFNFTDPQDLSSTIIARFYSGTGESPYTLKPDGDTLDWVLAFTIEELP